MKYISQTGGILYHADIIESFDQLASNSIDLTVTSPPYDKLRTYDRDDWCWDNFTQVAHELYRVTKTGGVVVWNVNDQTHNGSETGTSFRQAMFFMDQVGFKLHDISKI